MDKPSLQSIPPEMQAAIVSYISRPSDLKSLCLTCEQLRAVATEKLYHAVYLDLNDVTWDSGFLQVNHRGHRHIRSLAIRCSSADDMEIVNKDVRLALQFIPRNILKEFRTSQELKLELETLTLLLTQQMALESLCLSSLRGGMDKVPIDVVACVPKLQNFTAYFNNGAKPGRKNSRFYGKMIRNCRQLKCLELRANYDFGDDDLYEVPNCFEILGERSAAAVESFFGSFETRGSEKSYAPLRLEELHLRNLYLDDPEYAFKRVIQWENLGWLTLWRCEFCDELFKHLRLLLDNTQAKLRGLTYYYDDFQIVEPLCELQLFLRSFSGLEYLAIQDEESEEPFHLECLTTHLASLQHLMLGEQPNMSSDWASKLAQLQVLVKQAHKLKQLGHAFPRVGMRHVVSGDMEQYDSIIDTIATLPNLEVLNVLSFPDAQFTRIPIEGTDETRRSFSIPAYLEQELDPFANHFVQRFIAKTRNNKLNTLCFGSGSHMDVVHLEDGRFGFTTRRRYYAVEHTTNSNIAVRADELAMRYHEPMLNLRPLEKVWDDDALPGMCKGGRGQFEVLR